MSKTEFSTMEQPIVTISEGKIKGNQRINLDGENFYSFLAIPYAKPPIGEMRFKAPKPAESWNGIRDAIKEGNVCYQREDLEFTIIGSEDCLHLHVFTKNLPLEDPILKPVMVWIHGGAFMCGSNDSRVFGPEFLLTEDIVLVSIHYRVGFLGFLHLNDASLDVPGNAGMKDQQLALKWVQRNIHHFNGDPNNVTIFGGSSGGSCVHLHILSPTSKGLFHKGIVQSGCALNYWSFSGDFALEFAKFINNKIQTERQALEMFKKMPLEELYKYQEDFCNIHNIFGVVAPTIEPASKTAFLSSSPIELISSGHYNKVPLIFGYSNREGLYFEFDKTYEKIKVKQETLDLDFFVSPELKLKKDDSNREIVKRKIKKHYFEGQNAADKSLIWTDLFFVPGLIASAKLHAKTSLEPVYLYRTSIDAGLNWIKRVSSIKEPGAAHCDELGYIFNISIAAKFMHRGDLENRYIRRFIKLWTNFAKTGNPTPDGSDLNTKWKTVSEDINFLDIGDELTMQINPEEDRIKVWKEIFQLSPYTYNYL